MSFARAFGARRPVALLAALGLIAGAGLVAVGVADATPGHAATDQTCPPGTLPPPNNGDPDAWADNNIAVYAGKDLHITNGAAEVEGLLVAGRDALIDKQGLVNIGSVGVGSGTPPAGGTTMFAVGGDLTIGSNSSIDVGFGVTDDTGTVVGGNVDLGGTTSPLYVDPNPGGSNHDDPPFVMNGGTLTQNMGAAALAPWAGWGDTLTQESAAFAARADTGTATLESGILTFTPTDPSVEPQVFSVTGAMLAGAQNIAFNGIPSTTSSVIINVTGAGPIDFAPQMFFEDGKLANDWSSGDLFGEVSQRTMWNFPDATDVTLGGTSQVLGSVLVPHANAVDTAPTLTITASTNGRILTNGSILVNGQGNELHNYPWNAAPFQCLDAAGAFVITKAVDGAGAPTDVLFTGAFECVLEGNVVAAGEWAAAAGGDSGRLEAPIDSSCTVTEDSPPLRADGTWGTPTITGSPLIVTSESDAEPITVSVVNHWTPRDVPEVGAFTITKSVVGVGAPDLTFSGTWSCTSEARVVLSGDWSVAAGETTAPIAAPVGSSCTVTEDTPPLSALGTWGTPVVVGSPATIGTGSAQDPIAVTVMNTWTPRDAAVGAFQVSKVVNGTDAPSLTFTGTWTCTLAGETVTSGTWSAGAGETDGPFVAPAGASCAVAEDPAAAYRTGLWEAPVISGSPVIIEDGTVADPATVTVTNTWTAAALGAFVVTKSVTGDGAPVQPFTGDWTCSLDGETVVAGTWLASASETAGPYQAPVGASCAVTEQTPQPGDGGSWETPVITGSPVTISAGSATTPVQVRVANVWTAAAPTPTPSPTPTPTPTPTATTSATPAPAPLPATGGSPALWLVPLGTVLMAAGGTAIWVTARRRSR